MNAILNVISVTSAFLVIFGLLYLIQRFTIGFIPFFNRRLVKWISIGDATFCLTSVLYIAFYVSFTGPW